MVTSSKKQNPLPTEDVAETMKELVDMGLKSREIRQRVKEIFGDNHDYFLRTITLFTKFDYAEAKSRYESGRIRADVKQKRTKGITKLMNKISFDEMCTDGYVIEQIKQDTLDYLKNSENSRRYPVVLAASALQTLRAYGYAITQDEMMYLFNDAGYSLTIREFNRAYKDMIPMEKRITLDPLAFMIRYKEQLGVTDDQLDEAHTLYHHNRDILAHYKPQVAAMACLNYVADVNQKKIKKLVGIAPLSIRTACRTLSDELEQRAPRDIQKISVESHLETEIQITEQGDVIEVGQGH